MDFLQAIHTAEQRQAELDAHIHSEEKRTMKVCLILVIHSHDTLIGINILIVCCDSS